MSRFNPHSTAGTTLAAAATWSTQCLLEDGSVFSMEQRLWTNELLDELDRLFFQNLDKSDRSFLEKLEDQLQEGSAACRRLMAEALWVLMLFQSNISPEKKRSNVRTIWAWSGTKLDVHHPLLSDDVLAGLGSTGTEVNMTMLFDIPITAMERAFFVSILAPGMNANFGSGETMRQSNRADLTPRNPCRIVCSRQWHKQPPPPGEPT